MLTATRAREEIDLYRHRLAELYAEVRQWVTNRHPLASFGSTRVELSEESTGEYHVQSLDVALPGLPAVRFVPRGIFSVGARGLVDVRSRLGRETLVWVERGGPVLQITEPESVISRPLFPNVAEGWAWSDSKRSQLLSLSESVFWDRVLTPLTQ